VSVSGSLLGTIKNNVKGISSEKGSIVGGLKAGSMIGSLSIITGVPEGFLQKKY